MKKNYYFIIIMFIIISCKNQAEYKNDLGYLKIPVRDIQECNILKYSTIFDSIRFVKLETNENCLIGRIDKLIHYKNRFIILDKHIAKSIYIFNNDGKFIEKVGSIGKGPGQYIEPSFITLNYYSNEIMIYDNFSKKIISYDLDGKFLNSLKLEYRFDEFSAVGSNIFALYFNYYGDEDINLLPNHNVHIINNKGSVLRRLMDRSHSKIPKEERSTFFCRYENEILINPSYDNIIYNITDQGLSIKYDIDFVDKSLTKDFVLNISEKEQTKKDIYDKIENSNKVCIRGFCEMKDYLILNVSYRKMIYNVFYYKLTGDIKCSNLYINDMYGLIPGSHDLYSGEGENTIISHFIPSDIPLDYYKQIMRKSSSQVDFIKNEFLKNIHRSNKTSCLKKMEDIILSTNIIPTKREIEYINGITQNSNPVLMVCILKIF